MIVAEKITKRLADFPISLQMEVLDFVEFIAKKNKIRDDKCEDSDWSEFSLSQAMKGMENEEFADYSEADLKEIWR